MIGYDISLQELQDRIEASAPGWTLKAKERTDTFRTLGFYKESSSNWSKVKAVYMSLQGDCKCAFCERKLESTVIGKIEQDVEHFRPKGRVKAWRLPKSLKDAGVACAEVPDEDRGYYLLPYHPFNYSAACKPCNSALKRDHFPIAGTYDLEEDDPVALAVEEPLLIYPIGDFDSPPESLIHFYGVSPQAIEAAGHNRSRALVTIEFFKLDDVAKRKNLVRERAMIIVALLPQLEREQTGSSAAARASASALVRGFTSAKSSHANCARSFVDLYGRDPAAAEQIFGAAAALIESMS